jgi:hypothetical protein
VKTTLDITVNTTTLNTDIIVAGIQGARGEKGEKGDVGDDVLYYRAVAGEIIPGHHIVRLQNGVAYTTTALESAYMGHAVGITHNSSLLGDEVLIQFTGYITEPSWSFSPGLVFISDTGHISNTPSQNGYVQCVGRAVDSHTVVLQFNIPIRVL